MGSISLVARLSYYKHPTASKRPMQILGMRVSYKEAFKAINERYYGISQQETQWLVNRCRTCLNRSNKSRGRSRHISSLKGFRLILSVTRPSVQVDPSYCKPLQQALSPSCMAGGDGRAGWQRQARATSHGNSVTSHHSEILIWKDTFRLSTQLKSHQQSLGFTNLGDDW